MGKIREFLDSFEKYADEGLESKADEGLESKADDILEKVGFADYQWEDGQLRVENDDAGKKIEQTLNSSRKFSKARYDSKNKIVKFEE